MDVLQLFNLFGKTALVTGCNKGIGNAMAIGLAEAGADIMGVSANLASTGSGAEKKIITKGKFLKAYQFSCWDNTSEKKITATTTNNNIGSNNNGFIWDIADENSDYTDLDMVILNKLK